MQLICLLAEILSFLWLVVSLTKSPAHVGILVLSVGSAVLPSLLPNTWTGYGVSDFDDSAYSVEEVYASNKEQKMRNLAYSDAHRPEVRLLVHCTC